MVEIIIPFQLKGIEFCYFQNFAKTLSCLKRQREDFWKGSQDAQRLHQKFPSTLPLMLFVLKSGVLEKGLILHIDLGLGLEIISIWKILVTVKAVIIKLFFLLKNKNISAGGSSGKFKVLIPKMWRAYSLWGEKSSVDFCHYGNIN